MIKDTSQEFIDYMRIMGITADRFDTLHPAVQRAWQFNFETTIESTKTELFNLLETVKGEKE